MGTGRGRAKAPRLLTRRNIQAIPRLIRREEGGRGITNAPWPALRPGVMLREWLKSRAIHRDTGHAEHSERFRCGFLWGAQSPLCRQIRRPPVEGLWFEGPEGQREDIRFADQGPATAQTSGSSRRCAGEIEKGSAILDRRWAREERMGYRRAEHREGMAGARR